MKKLLLTMIFICSAVTFSYSQNGRIKQLKTAYITQQLDLTTAEARAFWPVYDKYYDALETYRKEQLAGLLLSSNKRLQNLNERQANQLLTEYTETETEIYKAKMDLISDLKTVLPNLKIAKLLIAEKNFNKQMLQRYQRRK
jgi:hypothetical protein